jgi:hypothetical protein
MKLFRKRFQKTQITRAEALEYIPVKNVQTEETRLDSGEILVVYTVTVRPWFSGLVKRFGGTSDGKFQKKLQLDLLGSEVWDLLDGQRSVREVVRQFALRHQLHPREAEVAVTRFLRDLGKRGLVGLR